MTITSELGGTWHRELPVAEPGSARDARTRPLLSVDQIIQRIEQLRELVADQAGSDG